MESKSGKRILVFALVVILGTSANVNHSFAEDMPPLVKGFLGIIANGVARGMEKEFNKSEGRNKAAAQTKIFPTAPLPAKRPPPNQLKSAGWCQVWKSGQIIDQEPCYTSRECGLGVCHDFFHWPSGGRTVVTNTNGSIAKINGAQAVLVSIEGNNCVYNSDTANSFCFTDDPSSLGDQSVEIVEEENNEDAASANSTQVRPEPAVVLNSEPAKSFDKLIEDYVTSLEADDPTAASIENRCSIGFEIISEHEAQLTGEIVDLLSTQMETDGCFG